jgi:UDP-3-O-[3-hydroxymyristoyl] glucosamine N-acyltransferase
MIIDNDIITTHVPHKLHNGSTIHRFSHVVKGAEIGSNVMIGEHCYIARDTIIGDNTRIQNANNIYDGCRIGENVFIGPRVAISNHHNPSINSTKFIADKVIIGDNAVLCINCTIVAPRNIGKNSLIGAGAVVIRDIEDNEKYYSLYKDKYENGMVQPRGNK